MVAAQQAVLEGPAAKRLVGRYCGHLPTEPISTRVHASCDRVPKLNSCRYPRRLLRLRDRKSVV